ncbi:uncharacterized protein LOC117331143 [Pecten maximus]|uniref:uncharacterized protein LOC117331143 n=1 Tax=Pecten maximus TaxID=6579 RepID=UPI0014580FC2|nr:uncharacterized protein LOC117331143 [Pecten maximus]
MYSHWVVLLLFGVYYCSGYIVPSGREPVCLSVNCQNGGSLMNTTCQCVCTDEYTGLLCETVVGHSQWPRGEYGLPMSTFGCPEEDRFGWKGGYINLTLPDSYRSQLWNDDDEITLEPHIMGPFHTHTMQLNFCLRQTFSLSNDTDEKWPPGEYCLYKVGNMCPSGDFTEGSITMHGYLFDDTDIGGELPNVTYGTGDSSIQLHFCCRKDGPTEDPISLPNTFPFILLKVSDM